LSDEGVGDGEVASVDDFDVESDVFLDESGEVPGNSDEASSLDDSDTGEGGERASEEVIDDVCLRTCCRLDDADDDGDAVPAVGDVDVGIASGLDESGEDPDNSSSDDGDEDVARDDELDEVGCLFGFTSSCALG
jgi:hypothetical protein